MMRTRAFVSAFSFAFIAAISTATLAQPAPSSNYTSFEATRTKPVQLGYYASAHKNCTPAPVPVVRVIEAPKSGTLTVRRGELKTDQIAGCPGLKMPAQVVFYQARAGATGSDHLVYEVDKPDRRGGELRREHQDQGSAEISYCRQRPEDLNGSGLVPRFLLLTALADRPKSSGS